MNTDQVALRLTSMTRGQRTEIDGALVERFADEKWLLVFELDTTRERRVALGLDGAALLLSARSAPPRVVRFEMAFAVMRALSPEDRGRIRSRGFRTQHIESELAYVTDPQIGAEIEETRAQLIGLDAKERDLTDDYTLGVTEAPAVYDGFGTLTMAVREKTRLVAMMKRHAKSWQVPRYASGNHVCADVFEPAEAP